MAQGLNVYYDDGHADNPVVITEPEEVRELFVALRGKYSAGSAVLLTIVPVSDPWSSELNAGIDGDVGVLHYSGEDHPEGVYSRSSTPSNAEPVIYYYVTADTEFPPNSEVPVADVEAAVVDYLTTGHRPESVVWQPTRGIHVP
ncbi:Imm1 family immunity protein [Saccharothrix sp. BKS2]|uniref:Imm1 family immunity protein n=1 Tax=Saccharothrix sp. BKS2 TaxID=3064400 RepID=UPI0039E81997